MISLAALVVFAAVYGDTPDEKHAWAVHDWNRPKPVKVEPAPYVKTSAPSDAVVLFDGTRESFERNWRDAKGGKPGWSYSDEGYFYCVPGGKNGGSLYSREEFGDCQLHIEYRHDPNALFSDKGPQMRGNSGVFLMGTSTGHEVQILESYFTSRELEGKDGFVDNYADGQAGSIYAENPPMVNPQRRPGEWQVYDIVFHQPVWDGDRLLHPGSLTVFFNGVLVQDHWEMEGITTHCRRKPLVPHAKKGPLGLQDHGCLVQFRNIWYRPLASRWDNKTHSSMSADPVAVMALRRETAARLYAKISDPAAVDLPTLKALAEVVSYANEGKYKAAFDACLSAAREKFGEKERADANRTIDVLVRNGVLPETARL